MKSIAVDLGGSYIKLGLMEDGAVRHSRSMEARSQGGLADRLPDIAEEIRGMLAACRLDTGDIGGIAFAFPGIVNFKKARIGAANGKYADGPLVDLKEWSQKTFGWGMAIDNDANAALLGEHKYGCAKGFDNAVLMILGTGVGSAAIMHGRLLRGVHDQAGWMAGHFITEVNGRKCNCGGTGCLETNASTWALPELARGSDLFAESGLSTESSLDFRILEKWAGNGDRLAKELLRHCVDHWSAALVTLIHAYDPELIVLSGGVMKCGDSVLEPMIENVRRWAWAPWGEAAFAVPENPGQSVLLGLHRLLEEGAAPGEA